MESYIEMKERQQKEMDAFPLGAAFTDNSFRQMMEEWGLNPETDKDKIIHVGAGCFIQKKDKDAFNALFDRGRI